MKAMSAINGIDLTIVTDRNYKLDYLPENTEVVYAEPCKDNQIGHAQFDDKNTGQFVID